LARAEGVIDEAAPTAADAVRGADLVVLAMPASAVGGWLEALAADDELGLALRPDGTVTDVASTKAMIVGAADALGLRFVGGHPMAGRETSGYRASDGDLFEGRPWVIVPGAAADDTDVGRVEWLARACRARPLRMSAAEHDDATAAVSHLPLLVAAALVESVVGAGEVPDRADWPAADAIAATGWHGMTRLARGEASMGAGILATNAAPVAARLRDLQAVLDDWLAALDRAGGPDETALRERLEAARLRLARGDPSR
jgi:prephenate dehydrogenase